MKLRKLKNANSLTFVATVLVVGLGFLTSVTFARLMGPQGRGELAAAQLWPSMLPYIALTGLLDAIVVYVARGRDDLAAIVGNSVFITVIVSIPVVGIGFVVLPFALANQNDSVIAAARFMLFAAPATALGELFNSILRGKAAWRAFNFQRLVVPVGMLAGVTILHVIDQLSVIAVIRLQVALILSRMLLAILHCKWSGIGLSMTIDWRVLRSMVVFGGKSHAGAVAEQLNNRIDQGMIAATLPPAQLGIYVTAVSATSLVKILSQSLKMTIVPSIAAQPTRQGERSQLVRSFRTYWTFSIVTAPVFAVALYWILPTLFGSEFADAWVPSVILVIGSVFFGAKDLLSAGAKAMGLPWLGSKAEIVAVVATVLLLLILLRPLGIVGAALASSLSYFLSLIVVFLGISREAKVSARDAFLPQLSLPKRADSTG